MAYIDYTLIADIMNGTAFFGSQYLLSLFIVFLSAVFITRDSDHLWILMFPLSIGWLANGLKVPTFLWLLFGILFVMQTLSYQGIKNVPILVNNLRRMDKITQTRKRRNIVLPFIQRADDNNK